MSENQFIVACRSLHKACQAECKLRSEQRERALFWAQEVEDTDKPDQHSERLLWREAVVDAITCISRHADEVCSMAEEAASASEDPSLVYEISETAQSLIESPRHHSNFREIWKSNRAILRSSFSNREQWDGDTTMTTQEACKYLGDINRSTLSRRARANKIKPFRRGHWRTRDIEKLRTGE